MEHKKPEEINRIIVVEDDKGLNQLINKILKKDGFEILSAFSAKEAIPLIIENPNSLLLLDYSLPDKPAKEILRLVAEEAVFPSFIIMTGYGDEKIAVEMMKLGAYDYLIKDSSFIEILPIVINKTIKKISTETLLIEAEETLKKSAAQWQVTFDASSDGIWMLDSDKKIIQSNQKMVDLFGISQKEMLGKHCWEIIHGTSEPIEECPMHQMYDSKKREAVEIEYGNNWFEVTVDPIKNDKEEITGTVHILREITERKKAEENSLKIKKYFQTLIEKTSDGIVSIGYDGNFKYASPSALRMFGYTDSDLLIKQPNNLTHPEDLPFVLKKLGELIENPKLLPKIEYRFLKKDGTWLWIESTFSNLLLEPSVEAIVINFRDISERKIAEAKIQENLSNQILLSDTAVNLSNLNDLESIYNFIGKKIHEIIPSEIVLICGFNHQEEYLQINNTFGLKNNLEKVSKILGINPFEFKLKIKDITAENLIGFKSHSIYEVKNGIYELASKKISKTICLASEKLLGIKHVQVMGFTWNNKLYGGAVFLKINESSEKNTIIETIINQCANALQRKFAQDKLSENEELYRTLVDTSPDAISLCDLEGNLININKKAIELFGPIDFKDKSENNKKRNIKNIFAPSELERLFENVRKKISGEDYPAQTYECIRENGHHFFAEINSKTLFDKNGKPHAILSILRDVTERKLAQEKIQIAHDRMRQFIDSNIVGVVIATPDGKIVEANDYYLNVIGYSRKDLENNKVNWRTLTPTEWLHVDENALRELRDKGKCQPYEKEYLRKDGKRVSVLITDALLPGDEEQIVGFVIDITDRKHIEDVLHQSEEKYRNLVETTNDLIWETNLEGQYTYVSPQIEKVLGYKQIEVIGKSPFDFMPAQESEIIRQKSKEIVNSKKSFDGLVNVNLHKDGYLVIIETSGTPVFDANNNLMGYRGIDRDISVRKQIEDAQIFLLQCGYNSTGEDFFESLARYLSKSLDMDYVCIDKLDGGGLVAHTIAVYNEGNFDTNVSYTLKETPCGDVVGKTICCIPENVCDYYPNDAALVDLKAYSYVGTTLWSFDGKPIGLIAVIGQKPLKNRTFAEELLKLVAIRASGELERKKAEEELFIAKEKAEESERQKSAIFSSIPDILFIQNKQGVYIDYHAPDEELLLVKPDKFIGKRMEEVMPKELVEKFKPVFETAFKQKEMQLFEYSLTMPDGVRFYEARIISYEENKVLSIIRDITERKKVSELLNQYNTRLELAMEAANMAWWEMNIITGNVNFGKRKAEMIGYSPDNFNHYKDFMAIVHPDDYDRIMNAMHKHIEGVTNVYEVEYRILTKSGEYKWFYDKGSITKRASDGTPINIIGLVIDITERKKAENELIQAKEKAEETENKFCNILDNTKIQLWTFDGTTYTYCSKNWYEYTGQELDTPLTIELWISCVHPEDIESANAIWLNNWEAKTEHDNYFRLKRHDGIYRYFYCHALPIFDKKSGLFKHFQGFNLDINEQVEADRNLQNKNNELIQAKEKAEESDRLKSAFLANMSHEIRTPMNGILGFAQLLNEERITKEERVEFVNIINESGNHLLALINDIIDIAKIDSNQVMIRNNSFNLNQILHELLITFENEKKQKGKEKIVFELEKPIEDYESNVLTDEVRVKQILYNLLGNALKFTKVGSIHFGYTVLNDKIQFFVKDTGKGIEPKNQKMIFERFRQEEESNTRQFGGSGLGLSISKGLVKLLGGEIWVESDYGIGATFYFTLPKSVLIKEPSNKTRKQAIVKDYNFSGKTILIVEDVDYNILLMKQYLQKTGATLIISKNGAEAVMQCNENDTIDLVIMDILLPVMDGYEATVEIKKFKPNLPIIALTAYAFDEDRENSIKAGCDDFASKPINWQYFYPIIDRYLNK